MLLASPPPPVVVVPEQVRYVGRVPAVAAESVRSGWPHRFTALERRGMVLDLGPRVFEESRGRRTTCRIVGNARRVTRGFACRVSRTVAPGVGVSVGLRTVRVFEDGSYVARVVWAASSTRVEG